MSKSFKSRTYLLTAALSFVFSCLIITFGFFPSFGLSLSLIIFALFSYRYIKRGSDTKLFLILSIVFSSLLFVRSEPSVTFFNFWAAIFFGILMLTSAGKKSPGFAGYLFLPISLFFKTLFTKSKYFIQFDENTKNKKRINFTEIIFGVVISIIVLAIILPLLSSTNPIFENILRNFLSFFNLERLIENIGIETIFLWCIRMVFFLSFLFIIPKVLTLIEKEDDYTILPAFVFRSFPLQIPKSVTAVILIIFFITQIQLYFANEQTLSELNISYSQRTREVFGQLSVVAIVVFVLIYNSKIKKKLSKKLNLLLGVEGIFLTLMAYKSVFEYIGAHGLTYKRLYGIVFATLVTGIFILYKNHIGKTAGNFARQVIILTASILILVNVVNFDFLIYHFNNPSVGYGVDYRYLSTLSPDSLSYETQFELLEDYTFNDKYQGTYVNENPLILLYKIESLQRKYSEFDLREFTLLDYIQYKRIERINTTKLRNHYDNNPLL